MIEIVRSAVLPAAYAVLPSSMQSPEATRLLIAIGWQESRFLHRRQVGGPATGFWQFELGGGVTGVLTHAQSKGPAKQALRSLQYPATIPPHAIHSALEHNDVLAAVFARLLLWTVAAPLATAEDAAWRQYLEAWRPGKPHPDTWADAWRIAAATQDSGLRA